MLWRDGPICPPAGRQGSGPALLGGGLYNCALHWQLGAAQRMPSAAAIAPPALQPPICLIHGPFGTGKSSLLVALLRLLLLLRELPGTPCSGARVLVSAHTNVAVDRVLLGERRAGRAEGAGSMPNATWPCRRPSA